MWKISSNQMIVPFVSIVKFLRIRLKRRRFRFPFESDHIKVIPKRYIIYKTYATQLIKSYSTTNFAYTISFQGNTIDQMKRSPSNFIIWLLLLLLWLLLFLLSLFFISKKFCSRKRETITGT